MKWSPAVGAAKPGTILYFDHPEGKEPARAEVLGREGEFFRLKFDHPVLEVLFFRFHGLTGQLQKVKS